MKTYRSVKYILVASVALLLFACSTDDSIWIEDGKEVAVSFRPTIDNSMASRAIGDASSIDELVVGVYNEDKSNLIYTTEVEWDEVQSEGVVLTLIEGRTFHILFWAQDGGNTAYTFTNNGIEVNYGDYKNGGFDKMEHLLAACRRRCSMAYEGKSSAYRTDEGHYFLLLGNHSGRRPPLSDRDGLLSVMEEYGVRQNAAAISLYIREHAVPICEDEAVWRLGRL